MSEAPDRPDPSEPFAAVLEESAEDLYDNAPCGYLSTTEDGVIIKVNQTFLRWTGYEREQVVGRRFQDLLAVGGRIYYETHIRPMLRMQGSVREIAVDIVRADDSRLPSLVNAMKRGGEDGAPAVFRTTIFDATERRSYEYELLQERKRAQESEATARLLAETLQAALIPTEPSQIPGVDVAAAYRPAGAGDVVGGDFYDVFETRRNDHVVVVGDVSGKGPEAAKVTAAARYTIRAAATRTSSPLEVLTAVNEVLLEHPIDLFCTAVFARVDRTADKVLVTIASAGHPFPLLVRPSEVPKPLGSPGTLLGVLEGIEIDEITVDLARGTSIVFYTDGVTEARAADGSFFGEERLCEILTLDEPCPAAEIAKRVVDEVLSFQDGLARDDIAVLVLQRTP